MFTGIVTVAALLIAATVLANRLTRPLRAVTQAARRLGEGDLTSRATGGPDAESAELATAFNAMASRLEQSEGLRRRAASDLAHDLATPATVLESQLQAMVDGIVPADAAQLEKARSAAAGLSGVIVQLGELTHAEAAPLQRHAQRVAMLSLIREIVDALDGLLRERGVAAEITGAETHATADPGQVTRALRNLLTNAVQHSAPGATVRIGVARGETVADPDRGRRARHRRGGPAVRVRALLPGRSVAGPNGRERHRPDRRAGADRSQRRLGRRGVDRSATGTTFRVDLPLGLIRRAPRKRRPGSAMIAACH